MFVITQITGQKLTMLNKHILYLYYMHFADKKKFCYSHAHIKERGTVQDQIRKRPQEK